VRYAFVRDYRDEFRVRSMCRVLKVSSSGFYAWLIRPESPRAKRDRVLLVEIRTSHAASRRNYGSPRVHKDLVGLGYSCGRKRVERLMRQNDIRAKHKRKFKHTTDSNHSQPVSPNHLAQNFEATAPNEKWVADITYIPTGEGWLYLATVMDLYSRMIIGWALRERMETRLVEDAMRSALQRRQPGQEIIHHSDRGSQYASESYQKLLADHGVVGSMSRRGNCYDNAVMESFFHSLKVECVHDRRHETREEARRDLFDWIECFYNRRRRHSSLGYLSPMEFELRKAA
jgi:putative transposase